MTEQLEPEMTCPHCGGLAFDGDPEGQPIAICENENCPSNQPPPEQLGPKIERMRELTDSVGERNQQIHGDPEQLEPEADDWRSDEEAQKLIDAIHAEPEADEPE